jgi:hypothetical protein
MQAIKQAAAQKAGKPGCGKEAIKPPARCGDDQAGCVGAEMVEWSPVIDPWS